MSSKFVCANCGYVIGNADTEDILKNMNRIHISGYLTIRVTNRFKPDPDLPSRTMSLFSISEIPQCSNCKKSFTFVKKGDTMHRILSKNIKFSFQT